jgi:hypothetical protein
MSHDHNDPNCPVCRGEVDMDAYREQMRELIAQHKIAIAGVFSNESGKFPFAYTVGLSLHGLPELLLVANCNLPPMALQTVINLVAYKWLEQRRVDLGVSHDVLNPFNGVPMPVQFVLVKPEEAKRDWAIQVEPILGKGNPHRFQVVQMILPDNKGKLPRDPEYDIAGFPQHLLTPFNEPDPPTQH